VGNQIKEMIDSFVAGNTAKASEIHLRLLPLVNAMFIVSNPIPVKYGCNAAGFRVGKPRLPLLAPDEKTATAIRSEMQKHKIDLPV
jgi:4-hydroxy-tetrahydrodipicolinate synthase